MLELTCLCSKVLRQYPRLSESADRVGGQTRGGEECPFSGVTSKGRVWRNSAEKRGLERVFIILIHFR